MTRARDSTLCLLLSLGAVAIAIAFTGAMARFTLGYSFFIGDDLSTMWRLHTMPLYRVAILPLGGQFVPLHRLVAGALDAIAPMNFPAAWFALFLSHGVAVVFLYKTLQILRKTWLNVLLVALYSTHPLLGVHFVWFSSGLTRMPYIALSLVSLHAYASYCRDPLKRHLLATAGAFVVALLFYYKAVLIPLYCLGLELVLDRSWGPGTTRSPRERWRRRAFLAAMAVVSMAHILLVRSFLTGIDARTNSDLAFQVQFQRLAWTVFLPSVSGFVVEFEKYSFHWPVWVTCTAVVALATLWKPRIWFAGFVGMVLISLNFALIAVSSRTLIYGPIVAFEHRYYFELMFLFVLFSGRMVHELEDGVRAFFGRHAGMGALFGSVALGAFAIQAAFSYREFERTTRTHYADMPVAKSFLEALLGDLGALAKKGDRVVLRDGYFPRLLDPMDLELLRYSQLVVALDPRSPASFGAGATHQIDQTGHIVRIRATRRRKVR